MKYTHQDIVGQIVADDYQTAAVFSKYGIDFCCRGNRTLDEVCQKNQIDPEELISALERIDSNSSGDRIDFQSWELDLLADYIEKKHHRYVRQRIPQIKPYLDKIVKVHGRVHPELLEIANEFDASIIELNAHMQKEELNLFPHIRNMVEAQTKPGSMKVPMFGTVRNPIQVMMEEHDQEGVRFRKIRKLSNDYTPPADACQTYRVTFAMLEEFEQDLHQHIHLENNILFPQSAELEEKMEYADEIQ